MSADMMALRDRLLLAALPHAPFDGWSAQTLRRAAQDASLSTQDLARAFPRGGVDAALHFSAWADRRMAADYAQHATSDMKLPQKVSLAILLRLDACRPHKEAARRSLALLALPGNTGRALAALYATVDAIWKTVGDQSVDFSFYTKRASLAAVYTATVLCWLDDRSEDGSITRDFLQRRLAEIALLPKLSGRIRARFERKAGGCAELGQRPSRFRKAQRGPLAQKQ